MGVMVQSEVKLDMKHGVEARNYDDIAKAEKLKPMEVRIWVFSASGIVGPSASL